MTTMVTTVPAAPVAAAEPGKLALLPLVRLLVFMVLAALAFNYDRFTQNFWGASPRSRSCRPTRRERMFGGTDGLIADGLVACGLLAAVLIWNGTISPL